MIGNPTKARQRRAIRFPPASVIAFELDAPTLRANSQAVLFDDSSAYDRAPVAIMVRIDRLRKRRRYRVVFAA
jgi:hypothetical protein